VNPVQVNQSGIISPAKASAPNQLTCDASAVPSWISAATYTKS
jgi:hypothetical protein